MKSVKRVVLIGGPSTGKTTLINALKQHGEHVHPECSREITDEYRERGVQQLFVTDPHAFSALVIEKRIDAFAKAKYGINYYDRGIPDVLAYQDHVGAQSPYCWHRACETHRYDQVFHLPYWREIHTQDKQRYEDEHLSQQLDQRLLQTYKSLGYAIVSVPFASVSERLQFILDRV